MLMPKSPAGPAPKLPSLDLGRFGAAMLVVCFHMSFMVLDKTGQEPLGMIFRGGHSGVEYFFILSGFIILWTHRKDINHPRQVARFAEKRAARIIPLLWLTLIGWGLLRLALPADPGDQLTPANLVSDLLLLPHDGNQTLGVTWTLRREAIFYMIFAMMIWRGAIGIPLMIVWQLLVVAQAATKFFTVGPEPGMLLGITNIGFGLGMAIAVIIPRFKIRNGGPLLIFGVLMYLGVMVAEWLSDTPLDAGARPWGATFNTLLYLSAACLVVMGMVVHDLERAKLPGERSRLIKLLGDSSYALYLVHLPFGSIAIRIMQPFLPTETLMPLLCIGAVLASVIVHLLIEKPALAWFRDHRDRRAKKLAVA